MTTAIPGIGGQGPDWVPAAARIYLDHVEAGHSIRALARRCGVHASTILRRVRRVEQMRDDPLFDGAIESLAQGKNGTSDKGNGMTAQAIRQQPEKDGAAADLDREARRVLRRLTEPEAVLAVAEDMENAVVVRDTPDGRTVRTAVTSRTAAEAMALRDWIAPAGSVGRVRRYRITSPGRSALKRLLALHEQNQGQGAKPGTGVFGDQHRDFALRAVDENGRRVTVRYNAAESPVTALARRRGKSGEPFLPDELVAAAERLREDFEMAQMGPRVTQNWERLMVGGEAPSGGGSEPASGPAAARARVEGALADLGPGLGDVALRCCCFLEGLEAAERRLGWSQRSGKIVLRIALQRLRQHYERTGGMTGVMIG